MESSVDRLMKDYKAGLRKIYGNQFLGAWLYGDRKSTRLNSSHTDISRMPSSA